jgi:hypothetical protein
LAGPFRLLVVRPPSSAAGVAAALDLAVVMDSPFLGARLDVEVTQRQ